MMEKKEQQTRSKVLFYNDFIYHLSLIITFIFRFSRFLKATIKDFSLYIFRYFFTKRELKLFTRTHLGTSINTPSVVDVEEWDFSFLCFLLKYIQKNSKKSIFKIKIHKRLELFEAWARNAVFTFDFWAAVEQFCVLFRSRLTCFAECVIRRT